MDLICTVMSFPTSYQITYIFGFMVKFNVVISAASVIILWVEFATSAILILFSFLLHSIQNYSHHLIWQFI